MSLYTEHAQIMLPLYIRGCAMGLLFAPMSTLALAEVPREKMAQATGMFNVIRQIGGSIGVAVLATMLTRRLNFHLVIDGQVVNQYSAAFQHIYTNLQGFARQAVGGTSEAIASQAKALIGSHITQQAYIQAIGDVFFIAAVITLISAVPIFFLRVPKKMGNKTMSLNRAGH